MKTIEKIIGVATMALSVGVILYLVFYIVSAIATMGGLLPALIYILSIEVY